MFGGSGPASYGEFPGEFTKTCPKCHSELDLSDKKCFHCYHEFPQKVEKEEKEEKEKEEKEEEK